MSAALQVELPPGLEAVQGATAASPFDPVALCAALDAFAQPVMRHSLCTVNRLDAQQLRLTRVYSSNPVAYPPGGSKDKRGTPWGQQVLVERRVFVGEGTDAIRASFDDHEAIARLQLRSIVNVPVVFKAQCLGTLNLVMQGEKVAATQVDFARLLGLLLVPVFRT
ncbi:MAG TPA: GAF domain-containing protein [Ramlibacter sp.]|jgi:transcriptional regulator with GAF, ATPase, and Fis domain|nr:GAF domain-containing protein [Ramlibacter sp.]